MSKLKDVAGQKNSVERGECRKNIDAAVYILGHRFKRSMTVTLYNQGGALSEEF